MTSQNRSTSMDMATRALPPSAWPPETEISGASKSVTVIPEVSCPAVSTCTRAGTSPNRSGRATQATAHTSCTGGPAPRGDDPPRPPREEGSLTDLYWSSAGSSSSVPNAPSSRIRPRTAALAPVFMVTSSPSSITIQPARKTAAAASGSAQMLYSAAGVVLPRPADPPMITNCRTQSASRGSRLTASAMLVSGPVATRVISPGAARTVSMM